MSVKFHQMAFYVALLVVCTTAELLIAEDHALDSDVKLNSFDFGPEIQTYFEEDVRQKREVEEAKHKREKGKGPRGKRKSSEGKGKESNISKRKRKSSNGKGKEKGKTKSSDGTGKGKAKRKSVGGKRIVKSTNNSKGKRKPSDRKGKGKEKRKSHGGKGKIKQKSSGRNGEGKSTKKFKENRKSSGGKGKSTKKSKGKRKYSDGKKKAKSNKNSKGKRKSSDKKGKGIRKQKSSGGKGKGKSTKKFKGKRKSSGGKGKSTKKSKGKRKFSDEKKKVESNKHSKGKRKSSDKKGKGKGRRQSFDGKSFDGKGKGKRKSNKSSKGKGKYSKLKVKQRRKSKRKGQHSKQSGKGRQTTSKQVNLTCLRDAVTYTKFLKDNVINFIRRNKRLTRQNSQTSSKGAKKGEFKEPAARLIQAGGGDKTNLSCSGSITNNGAKKMKATTDILDACEMSIKNACKPPSSINTTTLDKCSTNAIAFNKTVSSCIVIATKGKDACSCFQAAEVLKEKKILEKCKGSSEAQAAAAARKACVAVIQKCKNASTEASTLQYACRYSTDHLLKSLKQLTANSVAFKALLDKIKELTGLSPSMGPASNSTSRRARSEEEKEEEAIFDSHQARLRGKRQQQACSSITTTITTCTTTISNKPASSEVVEKCKTPTFTIGECSTADKTAIQKALNDALDKNAIIIAFIDSIKAELKAITGTTPDPASLTATAKVAARSRSVLRKMVLDKMNFRN